MEPQACCNCKYNNGTCQTLNNAITNNETTREDQYCCQEWENSSESDEDHLLT